MSLHSLLSRYSQTQQVEKRHEIVTTRTSHRQYRHRHPTPSDPIQADTFGSVFLQLAMLLKTWEHQRSVMGGSCWQSPLISSLPSAIGDGEMVKHCELYCRLSGRCNNLFHNSPSDALKPPLSKHKSEIRLNSK